MSDKSRSNQRATNKPHRQLIPPKRADRHASSQRPIEIAKTPITIRLKKADIVDEICRMQATTDTPLTRKQVSEVMGRLNDIVGRCLHAEGIGEFKFPGLLKIHRYMRPPSKARPGRNMRTHEHVTVPAKPARAAVRCQPLLGLRRMVEEHPKSQ